MPIRITGLTSGLDTEAKNIRKHRQNCHGNRMRGNL